MKPQNLVVILADSMRHDIISPDGPLTPHLNRLKAHGTDFSNAYCASPLCAPARASIATGLHLHQHRCWDNLHPYDGHDPSWAHVLRDHGHNVTAIGKMHFRTGGTATGLSTEILPLHAEDTKRDIKSLFRAAPQPRLGLVRAVEQAGSGDTSRLDYDRQITASAVSWLKTKAIEKTRGTSDDTRPWVLVVSFFCPHHPFVCPQDFFDLAAAQCPPMPQNWDAPIDAVHPAVQALRQVWSLEHPPSQATLQRAVTAYMGLCAFVDDNVGQVMAALTDAGLKDSSRIIFSSDHGEAMGDRGLWGKSTLYDNAARIPLIASGPEIASTQCTAPVSHVDLFASILEATGRTQEAQDRATADRSLWRTLSDPNFARPILSQYHGIGSTFASYMLRLGRWKLIHHVAGEDELFNMESDPQEIVNLAGDKAHGDLLENLHGELAAQLDPCAVDAEAKQTQQDTLLRYGQELLRAAPSV